MGLPMSEQCHTVEGFANPLVREIASELHAEGSRFDPSLVAAVLRLARAKILAENTADTFPLGFYEGMNCASAVIDPDKDPT